MAAPPAMARSRKPEATMQMSSTAWCLSQKQYASCTTTYTASTTTSCTDASRLTATAASEQHHGHRDGQPGRHDAGGDRPEPLGRVRAVRATSFASLTR